MASYIIKITELRDQLTSIGDSFDKGDFVRNQLQITLNGFSSSWGPFVQGVCACDKLLSFEKLWDDFVQEKTRLEIVATRDKIR